jgi:uncharacterized protein YycO
MIKFPRKKIIDVSIRSEKEHVGIDNNKVEKNIIKFAKKEYKFKEKKGKIDEKKLENYINNKEAQLQLIHTHNTELVPSPNDLMNSFISSNFKGVNSSGAIYVHDDFGRIIGKTQFSVDNKKIPLKLKRFIEQVASNIDDVNTKKVEMYYNKIVSDYILYNALSKNIPREKYDYIQERNLKFETYKQLGVILHFIPEKGYIFNKDKMEFKKK